MDNTLIRLIEKVDRYGLPSLTAVKELTFRLLTSNIFFIYDVSVCKVVEHMPCIRDTNARVVIS